MADYGIKVSRPGFDAKTADDKDMVFSTKYNGMKIKTHNTAGATTVTHSLGYAPSFLNYREDGSGNYRLDAQAPSLTAPAYATTTGVVFPNSNNYYFIFVDKGDV